MNDYLAVAEHLTECHGQTELGPHNFDIWRRVHGGLHHVKHGTPHTHAGDPLHDWIVVAEPKDDAA